jgi:hypothetical protein
MDERSPGLSRQGQVTLALLLIHLMLNLAFFGHAFATGTVIPHQDPTPERVAYERFQNETIGKPVFIGMGISGLATFLLAMAWVLRWIIRKLRPDRMENMA